MSGLLNIPPELQDKIASFLGPGDLRILSSVSHGCFALISPFRYSSFTVSFQSADVFALIALLSDPDSLLSNAVKSHTRKLSIIIDEPKRAYNQREMRIQSLKDFNKLPKHWWYRPTSEQEIARAKQRLRSAFHRFELVENLDVQDLVGRDGDTSPFVYSKYSANPQPLHDMLDMQWYVTLQSVIAEWRIKRFSWFFDSRRLPQLDLFNRHSHGMLEMIALDVNNMNLAQDSKQLEVVRAFNKILGKAPKLRDFRLSINPGTGRTKRNWTAITTYVLENVRFEGTIESLTLSGISPKAICIFLKQNAALLKHLTFFKVEKVPYGDNDMELWDIVKANKMCLKSICSWSHPGDNLHKYLESYQGLESVQIQQVGLTPYEFTPEHHDNLLGILRALITHKDTLKSLRLDGLSNPNWRYSVTWDSAITKFRRLEYLEVASSESDICSLLNVAKMLPALMKLDIQLFIPKICCSPSPNIVKAELVRQLHESRLLEGCPFEFCVL